MQDVSSTILLDLAFLKALLGQILLQKEPLPHAYLQCVVFTEYSIV